MYFLRREGPPALNQSASGRRGSGGRAGGTAPSIMPTIQMASKFMPAAAEKAGNEHSLAGDAKSTRGLLQGVVHGLPELSLGSPGFDGVYGLELLKGSVNLFQGQRSR